MGMEILMPLIFPTYAVDCFTNLWYNRSISDRQLGIYGAKVMKTLYMIGGTMGVGKTATCQILKKNLNNAVFLDGDWCWDADPFQVTNETKSMVLQNICCLLNNFIHCSAYENIIFCWVMHKQSIVDDIRARLDISNCISKTISLTCSPKELRIRLEKDINDGLRQSEIVERSIQRLPLYEQMDTIKIDTSDLSPECVAKRIMKL